MAIFTLIGFWHRIHNNTNYHTYNYTTNNEPQAIEIARQWNIDHNENKNIVVKTDYYTHTIRNNKKW